MKISSATRLLQVALVGACAGLVHAEDVDSKRSAVMRIIEANAPNLLTHDGELVADWKARLAATNPVAPVEWIQSDRAVMQGEVLDAITFWDDVSRYDLILDQDGAIIVDIQTQMVSDSFAFNVGAVPTVKNPDKVRVAILGLMARRNGDSGTFDMEVGNLTAETAMDALERSDAAAVFLNSGTVVALFFSEGILDSVLYSAPPLGEGGANGNDREAAAEQEKVKQAICAQLWENCTAQVFDFDACLYWVAHCQQTAAP